jgi:hypothetical protein
MLYSVGEWHSVRLTEASWGVCVRNSWHRHAKVRSIMVQGVGMTVHTFHNCHGTWDYGKKNAQQMGSYSEEHGCVSFAGRVKRPHHFTLEQPCVTTHAKLGS